MIVVTMSNAPPKLRGFLTKYLWEISTGTYVGNVNVRIREAIWKRIKENIGNDGRALIVFPSDNEQGFDFDIVGSAWQPIDSEGLRLIMRPSEQILGGSQNVLPNTALRKESGNEYIVLDLETTGLHTESDRILEIGAIRVVDGICIEEFNRMICVSVPDEICTLTGITQEMADQGVKIEEAIKDLSEFIAGRTVIGYNVRMFDARILKQECIRHGVGYPLKKIVDVMDISRRVVQGLASFRMEAVAEYLGIDFENCHRALPDCYLCNEIYMQLKGERAISNRYRT